MAVLDEQNNCRNKRQAVSFKDKPNPFASNGLGKYVLLSCHRKCTAFLETGIWNTDVAIVATVYPAI